MNEYFVQCSSRCSKEVWISNLPSKNFAVCIWCFLSCILRTVSHMFHKRRLLTISNKKQFLLSGIQGKPHRYFNFILLLASLVAQLVKNPPAMQETWVLSLGWEDLLEKGKAAHSSILAWRIPWTVQSMGSQSWTHWATCSFTFRYLGGGFPGGASDKKLIC